MKKATIADVAEKAQVSKASVSRYLKQESMREEIAARIQAAIEETGYVARGAKQEGVKEPKIEKAKTGKGRSAQSYRFGFLTCDITRPRTRNTIAALQKEFAALPATFSICVSEGKEELEEKYLTSYIVQNVDAILIDSCSSPDFIMKQLRTTAIPALFLHDVKEGITSCCFDEFAAGKYVSSCMLEHQHVKVAYLGCDEALATTRIAGIKAGYHEKKQPLDVRMALSDGTYLHTYETIKELFDERMDVVLLERDELAIPLQKFIMEYHISIPQNVSVISFGGHELCKVISPSITAVVYDYEAYAKKICQYLTSRNAWNQEKEIVLPYTMLEGNSVR